MSESIDYYPDIIETKKLLANNGEWRERYKDYAKIISKNLDSIGKARQEFKLTSALSAYINVTDAKAANDQIVNFTLKYLRQSVAKLTVRNGDITIDTSRFDDHNKDHFGCKIALSKASWRSPEANAFRSFFHQIPPVLKKISKEGQLENLLFAEFAKGTGKALKNIQPVQIEGLRFPMPTPLKASDHRKIEYAENGGHIDILTRIGSGGPATNLGIIELKDEYKKSEPACAVIKQALIYTTFIRELLRSEAGENWWKLFGFNNALPKKLVLYSICAMPYKDGADTSFGGDGYVLEEDMIQLHYIYFAEENSNIKIICNSLGTTGLIRPVKLPVKTPTP